MLEQDLRQRIDTIERAYEYFLAYAAQGLTTTSAVDKDGEARRHLERGVASLDGLTALFREVVAERADRDAFEAFFEALERDATATRAAFSIVLAQRSISSQLVDNLNASLQVRALLTDLFLLDEALQPMGEGPSPSS